ncbi:MAG: M14 family zinc carboxypeptidase [Reyranellaceae bacterium]
MDPPDAALSAFADVPLTSPGFVDGTLSYTTHDAMADFLVSLARRSHRARLSSLGRSQLGRDIPVLFFTHEGLAEPEAIAALGRPVIWLIAQQHGNEHAGGEAMLALAAALATGELAPLLERLSIVVVPRINPDGAAADQRVLASGNDLNRDHLLLSQDESRALHAAMRRLPPDVVFDHHEFSVARRWVEKFGGSHLLDVMILEATHPGVPRSLTDIARRLYRPVLERTLEHHGLASHDYVTTAADKSDPLVSLGGNAPGIARNAFGLGGSVSYLIETRGVGLGLQRYRKRVATHYVLAKALLEASAGEGPALRAAVAAARREAAADRGPLVVTHELARRPLELPLVDPGSGESRPTAVTLADSRLLATVEQRDRPHGYLVLREGAAVATLLALLQVRTARLTETTRLDVEAYDVERLGRLSRRAGEAINPDRSVNVTLRPTTIDVPAGALYVPMNQPACGIVAAALEPDSPGSYLGVGVIPMAGDEVEAPVYRVIGEAPTLQARLQPHGYRVETSLVPP